MPLKLTVTDLNEVPEALRTAYKQRGDGAGYIIDVEGGVVPKALHDEFRQKNVDLMKKIEGFGDVTPDSLKSLREEQETLKAELAAARKGKDTEAEKRIEALQAGLKKQIDDAVKERDGYKSRLESVLIDGEVSKAAAEIGAHATALDDISNRVRSRFKIGEDNKPYAVDAQGNKVFGEDGQPLGVSGVVRQLTKQAPHLFKPSNGGGASQQSAGGGRSTAAGNPWDKKSWNVTEQMKLIKSDVGEAKRLQAEAGVTS
jgi:hypothetical protein